MHLAAYVLNTLGAKNVNLKSIVFVHHVAFQVLSTNVKFFSKPETRDYFISEMWSKNDVQKLWTSNETL